MNAVAAQIKRVMGAFHNTRESTARESVNPQEQPADQHPSSATKPNHRCRLYRIAEGVGPKGDSLYVELWDSPPQEVSDQYLLARGAVPVATAIGATWEETREQMDLEHSRIGVSLVGDASTRGMI